MNYKNIIPNIANYLIGGNRVHEDDTITAKVVNRVTNCGATLADLVAISMAVAGDTDPAMALGITAEITRNFYNFMTPAPEKTKKNYKSE